MGVSIKRAKRTATTEGKWVELIEYLPGVDVLIVPSDDIEYRRVNTKELQPYAKQIKAGRFLDPETNDEVVAQSVVKGMLKGWRNLDDEDGNPIEYSPEKALELAEDPDYADFFGAILKEGEGLTEANASQRKRLGKR